MPITPNTVKVVNAISMLVIFFHLQSVKQMPEDQKNQCTYETNPQSLQREFIGYKVSDNGKPHHKLAYIIAILGEVVYLLLFQHVKLREQWMCHSAGSVKPIDKYRFAKMIC